MLILPLTAREVPAEVPARSKSAGMTDKIRACQRSKLLRAEDGPRSGDEG